MTMFYVPSIIARQFRFVREAVSAPNSGQRVEGIQAWCGGNRGASWCAYFATLVLDICFQGESPVPRTGSCQEIYLLAKQRDWLTTVPTVNDLFLYTVNDRAHHVGIVTSTNPLTGIAGNTSPDGSNPNGTGVFEHALNARWFVHYPRGDK
jgi:hypothetical protein